jgi:xylulokinase
MANRCTLSIDVGTGSVRAALVDGDGRILAMVQREHEQIVPQFGWAEQRPEEWWKGTVESIARLLAAHPGSASRIEAVAACGQMHGTVLIDADARLTRETVPLWNDKRTIDIVRRFEATHQPASYLSESGNPPTPAWPGFKLAWLKAHDAAAYEKAAFVIMPKDYINLRLTGEIAMDSGDASCSFLMNPATRLWSDHMIGLLGIDGSKLPPIREPIEILGGVTTAAARETGLREGTPVLVGAGDFPAALLGSGACRPGLVSDVGGTSLILTLIAQKPLLDPEISNVATVEGGWGPFVLLESGGDAMRWARRAFHDKTLSYAEIVTLAATAPAGAGALFFLPFLSGERLGANRNARAQFFGLGAGHGLADLHRAIMEGVAFAGARHLKIMEHAAQQKVERVMASGGAAKTPLWLEIKASIYGVPLLVPEEAECGVVGSAAMAAVALGRFPALHDAVSRFVRYAAEVKPNPRWAETYARMQPVFDRIYANSQPLYTDLDALLNGNASSKD